MNIQVIGVCGLSLPCTGGFQAGPEDLEARAAFLFGPARLAARFAWFEQVTLPSLLGQTDQDARFVVLASAGMPASWRERLLAAVPPGGPVEVDFAEPAPHPRLCNDAITARIADRGDVVAQFRVDDDGVRWTMSPARGRTSRNAPCR